MKFPPVFMRTPTIDRLIYDLDALKLTFDLHPISPAAARFLRQTSILKSALFSARIEGNPLTLDDVRRVNLKTDSEDAHTKEVANIMSAYESLDAWVALPLSRDLLRNMHAIVMRGLSSAVGSFRMEESAIFNQAGTAVYLTPQPQQISALLDELIDWVLSSPDPRPIVAAVSHIWFEKIHPFDDGNGRVGRLLSSLLLVQGGFHFGSVVPFEEYLDRHHQAYYDALGKDRQDVTEFVEFFLDAVVRQAQSQHERTEGFQPVFRIDLLPRRGEIVEIVREHKMVSFDFISRRFRRVPSRTLHYDLSMLIKSGHLRRLGTTRGALYIVGEKTLKLSPQ